MGILFPSLNESRSHRVVEDIANHLLSLFVRAQNPIVITLLPEGVTPMPSARDILGTLFSNLHKSPQVRPILDPFHEEMHMVWHETVGEQRKRLVVCGVAKLVKDVRD